MLGLSRHMRAGRERRRPAHSPVMPDPLMTIDQAAEYLAVPKSTLYTWRTRRPGFGPRAIKLGGTIRYRRSDLDAWIEAHAEPLDEQSL